MHNALRVEKKLSTWSWCGTFGISFSSAEGMSPQPIQNYVALFRVTGKTPGLVSRNNFVLKKILSASVITIMSCKYVTRPSLCSGVKENGTKRAHNFLSQILFQNSKILLSFLMRFEDHFWPNHHQRQFICANTSVSVAERPDLKQKFMATLCFSATHDV